MDPGIPTWAADIIAKLERIERALAKQPEQSETVTVAEACAMTGHKNYFGLLPWAKKWNLAPYKRGHYRREDVRAAIARAALTFGNTVRRKKRAMT
ncbi:hypothetical protein CMV30_18980 [Nibricoccus aquaticus]|uniref:HTH merR-type domain-containing protein n=1 Tax=Nibricoccus aquaticus TaxID=2576891 RepID=A0A290QNF3_9BACT|nr:hypothetical protein [Nibricoccus aquaticus]ATC65862.1 hypothetical protein CMV30_18980 [Nibricoccus aquaticus]